MSRRVLFMTPALLGHIHPMVPLAQAVAARGNEVLWATPADGVGAVERAGLGAVATGRPGLADLAEARRRFPDLYSLPPEEAPEVTFAKLFGAIAAPAVLADLVPVALEWRPELVVADAADFAGHIVAAELGVPSVTKGFGPLLPERRVRAGGDEVAPLWRSRGLMPRPYGGAYDRLYIDTYPPELQTEAAPHITRRQLMRPVGDDGQLDTSSPLPLLEGRSEAPLVYVTMGTVFNNPPALQAILAGLRDLPVRVLVTVGPAADPSALGPQPDHVRVERYVPQTRVLRHCGAVVSHAGSGTVLGALACGIPQLCLPQGADQFLNAAAVATSATGLALMPGEVTAEAVRLAVGRLLDDDSFRAASRRLSASIETMPSPEEVAALLETLV